MKTHIKSSLTIKYDLKEILFVICLAFFCFFFGYLSFSLKYVLLAGAVGLCGISFFYKKGKIVFTLYDLFYLLFVLYSFVSIFWSKSFEITNIIIWVIAFLISKFNFENSKSLYVFYKFSFVATFIHLIGVILQSVFPVGIIRFDSYFMDSASIKFIQNVYNSSSACVGFANQTGVVAFYISLFIGIVFTKLLVTDKKKMLSLSLIIVAFIGLLLTQKRALFIFTGVAMLFIYLLFKRASIKKFFTVLFVVLLFASALYLLLNYTDIGNAFLSKFQNGVYGDTYSNRENIYSLYLNSIGKNIVDTLFGNGLGSTKQLLLSVNETQGHFIYLQVLYESGIVGLAFLVLFIISAFFKTCRCIKKSSSEKNTQLLLLSVFVQIIIVLWGFTGNPLYDHYIWIIYLSFIASVGNRSIKFKTRGV